MSIAIPIAMFGWLAVVPLLFLTMPARRAVIAGILGGWLFLPNTAYFIDQLPDYTKVSATTAVVLVGALLFDFKTFGRVRPAWYDLPIVLWCAWPLVSSLSTGLGAWDGFSQLLNQVISWGIPYMLGRVYFRDPGAVRELALGFFIAALVYLPLVAFEIRMSPQLHSTLYGFHQHEFAQSRRGESWRPTVFLQHGLAVGMFMGSAAVLGFWLWRSGAARTLRGWSMLWLAAAVVTATVLSGSFGAVILMAGGIGALWAAGAWRARWPVFALVAFPILYMTAKVLGGWRGYELLSLIEEFNPGRAGSLGVRLRSENGAIDRMQGMALLVGEGRFVFGGMVVEEGGTAIVPDGYWLIALVRTGAVGLAGLAATLLLPAWMCITRLPARAWSDPRLAPIVALAVVVALWMVDNLFNAMINPVFPLAAGAVQSVVGEITAGRRVAGQVPRTPAPVSYPAPGLSR